MYVSFNLKQLIMFPMCFTLDQNGTLITMSPNNAVSLKLLAEIQRILSKMMLWKDKIFEPCYLAMRFIAGQKVHYSRF